MTVRTWTRITAATPSASSRANAKALEKVA